eukprot:Rhum_TRINITY_DN12743_c0_g1::Rhum_TRINITY_DN12743_c0_g1_i1::g.53763::m.53763
MAQLTEEGLVERKREFAAEIESLEVALESVVSEGPGHVDVVSEISEAVEKSRRVLQDLDHAVRSFREATAEGRPFTQEEIDLFRYFGFEPQPHASPSPSPTPHATHGGGGGGGGGSSSAGPGSHRSHQHHHMPPAQRGAPPAAAAPAPALRRSPDEASDETETNVYDTYQTRPSPESLPDLHAAAAEVANLVGTAPRQRAGGARGGVVARSASGAVSRSSSAAAAVPKEQLDEIIHSEVEARVGEMLTSAEVEIRNRLREIGLSVDHASPLRERGVLLPAAEAAAAASAGGVPQVGCASFATQTDDDVADLFGIDSADLLESKINDLVAHRVRVERERLDAEDGQEVRSLRAELEAAHRMQEILSHEKRELQQRVQALEEEREAARRGEGRQAAADLPAAVHHLQQLAGELERRSQASAHEQRGEKEARLESLHILRGMLEGSTRGEAERLRRQLERAKEGYRREMGSLTGQLEGAAQDGAQAARLLHDSSASLHTIMAELAEKKFDYNPPAEKGTHRDPLDEHVARTLSAIRCPVPIDCHKVGPSEYCLDRRLHLKLSGDTVYIVKKSGAAERLADYVRRLYAPFIDLGKADPPAAAIAAASPSEPAPHYQRLLDMDEDVGGGGGGGGGQGGGAHGAASRRTHQPLNESNVKELKKLHTEQRELLHQLGGGPGEGAAGAASVSPSHKDAGAREGAEQLHGGGGGSSHPSSRTYAERHTKQADYRRSHSSGVPHASHATGLTKEETETIVRFFELTDRSRVGLVTKPEMLRTLRKYPEVASRLRGLLVLPQEGALEYMITAIPGGDAREITWEALHAIMQEIKHQQRHQLQTVEEGRSEQQHGRGVQRGGGAAHRTHSAKAFNDRIQQRQREMTRDLLETGSRAQRSLRTAERSHSQGTKAARKNSVSKLDTDEIEHMKAQALRTQMTAMRKKQALGLM